MPILGLSQQQLYSLQKLTDFQLALLVSVCSTCSSAQTNVMMCVFDARPGLRQQTLQAKTQLMLPKPIMPSYRTGNNLPQRESQLICWAAAPLLKAASDQTESCLDARSRMHRMTGSATHLGEAWQHRCFDACSRMH